ncbi:hypothetical protein [Mycoplana sp. MJR14]|uniref:hypothetical protein n=1 Tax=Mycoplana sp. MJR14 TaxID=3032583 RepID=UPI0023DAB80C|nr:hypothetical protein [Mycoplana sp. MJR14]MDF1631545.1 hypothetical protein [Mycoplana sp. MJR14]
MSKPKIVVDLDGTLTLPGGGKDYAEHLPNEAVVERLREYRVKGFEIVIHTARNMRTHSGNVGLINVHTLPTILAWLEKHDVPHDEVHVGKPWCGNGGFYVDDRAIRPDEFAKLSYDEVRALMGDKALQ